MSGIQGEVRQRTISGFRWALTLNLVTTPLSLLTNMLLGRASPLALGYYSAVLIFVGGCDTFLTLGGLQVLTRFVPTLKSVDRLSFLVSYTSIVLSGPLLLAALGATVLRGPVVFLLERFGDPPIPAAIALALIALLMSSAVRYLYGVLEAPRAALSLRLVVVGFFGAAVLAYWPLRGQLTANPSAFLWSSAVVVYSVSCAVGVASLWHLQEIRQWRRVRWFLPPGFWPVVFYAQVTYIVTFVYIALAPTVVLLWLDVESLARLHAALRLSVFLKVVPVMLANVLAPGLARLNSEGLRDEALRDAGAALKAMILLTGAAGLALVLFAGDAMALFGPGFREYRDLLRIVAVSTMAAPLVYLGAGMAAAFSAFRSYLIASLVYIAIALALAVVLVPTYGLTGAALATTLGAFVLHSAIAFALRVRLGFRVPSRVYAAWACSAAVCLLSLWIDPDRLTSVVLFIVFLGIFWFLGGTTWSEVKILARRLTRRA